MICICIISCFEKSDLHVKCDLSTVNDGNEQTDYDSDTSNTKPVELRW